ncbi:MAG TPA: hypothetical protein VJ486_11980 [Geothrix sp.]|nr:hypothetical protein [Geothrix sp.]
MSLTRIFHPLLAGGSFLLLLACGGSSGPDGSASTTPPVPPGSITVTMSGDSIPDGSSLTLTDAGGHAHALSQAFGIAHLDQLTPGPYTLGATGGLVDDVQMYDPSPASQTIQIESQQTTQASVNYVPGALQAHGTIRMTAAGLPAGSFGIISYTWVCPTDQSKIRIRTKSIDASGLLFPAAPSSYHFEAGQFSVTVNGVTQTWIGTATPTDAEVKEGQGTDVAITYVQQ